jgi:adenine-specific DNA-methyltransferase
MCRETIGRAVVQKFNEAKGWNCQSIDDLHNHIGKNTEDIKEANRIFNTVRICDPAVGSGHFLVSALNEMIWLKYKLEILADKDGKRFKSYNIEVSNDELVITDGEGNDFAYNPKDSESQWIQEVLFNEKRIIIENCLFGVDVNHNSVEICRLRLWIELLKNAYYRDGGKGELETLPNIDINIKHGNSLISRFDLYEKYVKLDYTEQKKLQGITKEYKDLVFFYKECSNDRNKKKDIFEKIGEIKRTFNEINDTKDPDFKKWHEAEHKFKEHTISIRFDDDKNEWQKRNEELQKEEERLKEVLQEKKEGAFEWSFEFPEVMDENGNFIGFDIVIGNPPYLKEGRIAKDFFEKYKILPYYQGKMDLWYIFACIGINLLKEKGILSFIATNNWTTAAGASKLRNYIIEKTKIIQLVDFGSFMVFDIADIQTMIMSFLNDNETDNYSIDYRKLIGNAEITDKDLRDFLNKKQNNKAVCFSPMIIRNKLKDKFLTFSPNETIFDKIAEKGIFLKEDEIAQGIVPNPDVVNNKNIAKIPQQKIDKFNIKVGDGVFVLNKSKLDNLPTSEQKYVKPLFEPTEIDRYNIKDSDLRILYITKQNYNNDAPTLIGHLEKYKEIMDSRRENLNGSLNFFHLHWSRDSSFFEKGNKILVVRKCNKPTFAYTEREAYVMMAVNIIKTNRFNLKYLVGLLNSKLIAFWLRNKGKMQGDNYQLDKEPLLQIPIFNATKEQQQPIISIVNQILSAKDKNPEADTAELERKMDELVYGLYGLTEREIDVAEEKII